MFIEGDRTSSQCQMRNYEPSWYTVHAEEVSLNLINVGLKPE